MAKVTKLRKDESIRQLKNKLQTASKNSSGIRASKYSGVLTLKEDPASFRSELEMSGISEHLG